MFDQGSDRVVAGIDVSKRRLDVHVAPSGEAFSVSTDRQGLLTLLERLKALGVSVVGLEASGGYERDAVRALTAAAIETRLLDPVRVRRFAGALGMRAKNDPLDAALIAAFVGLVETRAVRPEEARDALRELVSYRRQLIDETVSIGNQMEGLRDPELIAISHRHQDLVRQQIDLVQHRIAALIKQHTAFHAMFELLIGVPGVGPVLATTVVAEMPEIGTIGRHPLAAPAGLAPYDRDTGTQKGKRHIFGSRKTVRNVLYMATLSAIRHNPVIGQFHQRLIENGKDPKVAITACMRKLLIILNAIIRDQKPWQNAGT